VSEAGIKLPPQWQPYVDKLEARITELQSANATLEAKLRAAEVWNQKMVEKAASGGVLEGYREQQQKILAAVIRAETAEAKLARVIDLLTVDINGRRYTRPANCDCELQSDITDELEAVLK
jgi:hypothetical protein